MSKAMKLCELFQTNNSATITQKIKQDYLYKYDWDVILGFFHYAALYVIENNIGDIKLAKHIINCIRKTVLIPFNGTMTLTFGEVAESHVGMQKIGQKDKEGFSYNDLLKAQKYFNSKGCKTILLHLNNFLPEKCHDKEENEKLKIAKNQKSYQAWILVAKKGIECLTGDKDGENLLTEMLLFKWDTKLYNERRDIVQEKRARHNLNFSNKKQTADFTKGKGTTIPWGEVPLLLDTKNSLVKAFGDKANNLNCEGNLYYIPGKTGIGYHGDTERKKVIGVRFGGNMNINYMWHYNNKPRGMNVSISLEKGDIYCMSEKTVGTDWLDAPKKQFTLRHAAGGEKYTTKTDKIWIKNQREWQNDKNIIIGDIWYKPKKSKSNPNPKWTNMDEYC